MSASLLSRQVLAMSLSGLVIAGAAAGAIRLSRDERSDRDKPAEKILAIVPFRSLDQDSDSTSFGVGLADSLISHLSRAGLIVRPMSAALAGRDGPTRLSETPVEAGRRLLADAVMAGECRRTGDRFSVKVRLLDVPTGRLLWERSASPAVSDLPGIEKEIVADTLASLLPALRPAEPERGLAPAGRDATSYYLYLLALGRIASWRSEPTSGAVELLEQAIARDPDFADAHAALSVASADMFYRGVSSDTTWIDRAVASGRRAVSLDGKDPSAHFALAHAVLVSDPAGAAHEVLEALRLDRNHADALRMLATLLSGVGATAKVRALRDRVVAIDPSMEVVWLDVRLAIMDGRLEQTVEEQMQELERRKKSGRSQELPIMSLGYMAFVVGDSAAGLRWSAMLEAISTNRIYADTIRLLALARSGDVVGVNRIIQDHREAYQHDWEYALWVAQGLALAGDRQSALEWIELSASEGNYDAVTLERSAALDSLRGDRRFGAALDQVRDRARAIAQLAEFAGYL